VIQPYRTLHRRGFLVLLVLLPTVLVAGLHYRRRTPRPFSPEPTNYSIQRETDGYWQSQNIHLSLLRKSGENGTWLQLTPTQKLAAPDVLVYWSAQLPEQGTLPANAQLLGPLDPATRYRLPEPSDGHLVLYSLPLNTVLDSTSLGMQP
jgi:hypothetical protein